MGKSHEGRPNLANNVKILVSHVNDHQVITVAEDNFNNQRRKMTHSVDASELLFPANLVIKPMGSWAKWP